LPKVIFYFRDRKVLEIMKNRSYEIITPDDLQRLGAIAKRDREDLFQRVSVTGGLYRDRLFAVALCQGAALHYIDGITGVKDFDVWSFYQENPVRPFPYRRRGMEDFSDSKFGITEGSPYYTGRKVDLLGRSIYVQDVLDPVGALRNYLSSAETSSARHLAQKAMILIEPVQYLGTVVWPEKTVGNS
jgi:hypothetical protein